MGRGVARAAPLLACRLVGSERGWAAVGGRLAGIEHGWLLLWVAACGPPRGTSPRATPASGASDGDSCGLAGGGLGWGGVVEGGVLGGEVGRGGALLGVQELVVEAQMVA